MKEQFFKLHFFSPKNWSLLPNVMTPTAIDFPTHTAPYVLLLMMSMQKYNESHLIDVKYYQCLNNDNVRMLIPLLT